MVIMLIVNGNTVHVNKKLPFKFRAVPFLFHSTRKHACFIVRILIISVLGVAMQVDIV